MGGNTSKVLNVVMIIVVIILVISAFYAFKFIANRNYVPYSSTIVFNTGSGTDHNWSGIFYDGFNSYASNVTCPILTKIILPTGKKPTDYISNGDSFSIANLNTGSLFPFNPVTITVPNSYAKAPVNNQASCLLKCSNGQYYTYYGTTSDQKQINIWILNTVPSGDLSPDISSCPNETVHFPKYGDEMGVVFTTLVHTTVSTNWCNISPSGNTAISSDLYDCSARSTILPGASSTKKIGDYIYTGDKIYLCNYDTKAIYLNEEMTLESTIGAYTLIIIGDVPYYSPNSNLPYYGLRNGAFCKFKRPNGTYITFNENPNSIIFLYKDILTHTPWLKPGEDFNNCPNQLADAIRYDQQFAINNGTQYFGVGYSGTDCFDSTKNSLYAGITITKVTGVDNYIRVGDVIKFTNPVTNVEYYFTANNSTSFVISGTVGGHILANGSYIFLASTIVTFKTLSGTSWNSDKTMTIYINSETIPTVPDDYFLRYQDPAVPHNPTVWWGVSNTGVIQESGSTYNETYIITLVKKSDPTSTEHVLFGDTVNIYQEWKDRNVKLTYDGNTDFVVTFGTADNVTFGSRVYGNLVLNNIYNTNSNFFLRFKYSSNKYITAGEDTYHTLAKSSAQILWGKFNSSYPGPCRSGDYVSTPLKPFFCYYPDETIDPKCPMVFRSYNGYAWWGVDQTFSWEPDKDGTQPQERFVFIMLNSDGTPITSVKIGSTVMIVNADNTSSYLNSYREAVKYYTIVDYSLTNYNPIVSGQSFYELQVPNDTNFLHGRILLQYTNPSGKSEYFGEEASNPDQRPYGTTFEIFKIGLNYDEFTLLLAGGQYMFIKSGGSFGNVGNWDHRCPLKFVSTESKTGAIKKGDKVNIYNMNNDKLLYIDGTTYDTFTIAHQSNTPAKTTNYLLVGVYSDNPASFRLEYATGKYLTFNGQTNLFLTNLDFACHLHTVGDTGDVCFNR